jgi:ABC-type phosphate transport system permease subunit
VPDNDNHSGEKFGTTRMVGVTILVTLIAILIAVFAP